MERSFAEYRVRALLEQRRRFSTKKELQKVLNRKNVSKFAKPGTPEDKIEETLSNLEKIAKFIPIRDETELEEIIKLMQLLADHRARYNYLYDKTGIDFMKRVRESMAQYFTILSELRMRRKEYIPYWFTDDYWISEWSKIFLGLGPEDNMTKFGYDLKARDFLFLLTLELACADSASGLETPMIRLKYDETQNSYMLVPTESAAKEFLILVDKIHKNILTFTDWVNDNLFFPEPTQLKVKPAKDARFWKIALTGDGAVGKTSIRKRYLGEGFSGDYISTFGADFALHTTDIGDTNIQWQIWDLAGQPRFTEVIKAYFNRIFGAVLVYDVTRQTTFENVENWINEIWDNSGRKEKVPIVLLANKIDLREEGLGQVSTDEGRRIAEENGLIFIETSAKTGEGINEAFEKIGLKILEFTAK